MNKRYVFDIETNTFLANMLDYSSLPYKLNKDARLWCVVFRDVDTDEVIKESLSNITKDWMKKTLEGVSELIAHNGLKFDLVCLKLFGVLDYEVGYLGKPDLIFGKEVKITDTLIWSRLFNPDRRGGHSLEAWGKRLGDFKDDFRQQSIELGLIDSSSEKGSEFNQYSDLMVSYCVQDTNVTSKLYKHLEVEWLSYKGWHKAEKLENKLADLAVRRETYGFKFNKDYAIECLQDLTEKMEILQRNVNPLLPLKPMTKTRLKDFTPPSIQFKKNGEYSANLLKFADKVGADIVDGVFIYKGELLELPLT